MSGAFCDGFRIVFLIFSIKDVLHFIDIIVGHANSSSVNS